MANVGTLNLIIKFNTKNLSIPLRLFIIPAKAYTRIVKFWYAIRGKDTCVLQINISSGTKSQIDQELVDVRLELESVLNELENGTITRKA